MNDGYDADAGDGRHYPVGSLIVRPGCTFYQFHESHYNGGWNVYEGKPLKWCALEIQQSPFYIVNRVILNHHYLP